MSVFSPFVIPRRASYNALSVRFDGNDHGAMGSDLAGISDGTDGAISVWVNRKSSGARDGIWFSNGSRLEIYFESNDTLRVNSFNGSSFDLQQITATTYTSSTGWIHILSSWTSSTRRLYVNDAAPSMTTATRNTATIDYTRTDHEFGRYSVSNAYRLDADVADFWFVDSYIDFSSVSNRRLFIDASNKPVDLGSDGSNPGVTPVVFYGGSNATVDTWLTDRSGNGNTMTLTGTLTAGSSSPSD